MFRMIAVLLSVSVVVVVAGCGGSGQGSVPTADTVAVKINEYVGDGHNGTRPLPDFLQAAEVTTQRLGDLLGLNNLQLTQIVPEDHTNYFRVGPVSISVRLLVTIQPTNDGDPDLYVRSGNGNSAGTLAISNRVTNTSPDGAGAGGFIPDWAAFSKSNTNGLPSAQVAVYGANRFTSQPAFTIEADRVFDVTVDGPGWAGTLPQGSSHWVKFAGVNGTQYTVRLIALAGDPDVYVYGLTATTFKGKDNSTGLGNFDVTFTASANQDHYVRIYGFSGTPNQYQLLVMSP